MQRPQVQIFTFFLALILPGCGGKEELTLTDAWARSASAGSNGEVYLVIDNQTRQPEGLLFAHSEAADAAQIHLSSMDAEGVMSLKGQSSILISPEARSNSRPVGSISCW